MESVWARDVQESADHGATVGRAIGNAVASAHGRAMRFVPLAPLPFLLIMAVVVLCCANGHASSVIESWRGGTFTSPVSVSVYEADGSCWVADSGANEVVRLAANGTELWRGTSFNAPWAVSVDQNDGSCWVSDRSNNEVVHLAADGTELLRIGGFSSPRGLSVDPTDGSCWVADFSHNEIVHLAADGVELWRGGGFYQPVDTGVDVSDGSCWVADFSNNQVVHLAQDGTELVRVSGFSLPIFVSANPTDNSCWVADYGNSEIVHLDSDGTELWRGTGFTSPRGTAVATGDSTCWAADTGNNEIVHLDSDGTELWRGSDFSAPLATSLNTADGTCWVADSGNAQVVHLSVQYALSLDGTNGSVEVDTIPQSLPWSGDYISGTEVVLEAIPDSTYEFSSWSGGLTGSENPTTVTVTSDMSITANFSKIQYQLNLTGVGEGTVLVNGVERTLPWSGLFDAETSVNLEAVPGSCYTFGGWTGDLTGVSNPKSLTMTGPKAVTANFGQLSYDLDISGVGAGSVSVDGVLRSLPWTGTFDCGDTVTLEAVPDSCWQFSSWSGDLTGSDSPDQIVIDGEKNVTANFEPIEYTLSIAGTGSGSIVVDGTPHSLPWSEAFVCGTAVTVEAVPNSCYEFDSWSGDLSGDVNPRVLTMSAAKSITADFSMIQYTLEINADGDGAVTVDGEEHSLPWSGLVDCGSVVTLDAVPDSCYEFSGWTGAITWASTPVDIAMDGDKNLTASFSQVERALSIDGLGGSVIVDGTPQTLPWSGAFLCGETVSLEAVPDEHREFEGWSGDLTSSDNPTSIVVDGDKSVTASFGYASYTISVSATGEGSVLVDGTPVELPWAQPYVYGTSVVLTAEPGEGARFSGWSGAISSSEAAVSVEIMGPTSVTAVFGPLVDFSDIEGDHWAIAAIAACVDAGIVFGYDDGLYRPDLKVTRAAMAVYIARGIAGGQDNVPAGPEEPTFPDVGVDHWAYDGVEYSVAANVATGYGDGSYQPSWVVSRAQMAVFVARAIVDPTGEEGLADYTPPAEPAFTDVPTTYWCFAHVEYLAENDVVSGYADGYYRPTADVTRDQMAVYIAKAFGLLP